MSSDLKWNMQIDFLFRKAMRRIFIIRNLRRCDCPHELILRAYHAFIRQILLYAYPCVCNASGYLKSKLTRVESRVSRIVGRKIESPLMQVADNACKKLMENISTHAQHPLREIFIQRNAERTRSCSEFRRPFARTVRFGSSFIKFAS